MSRNRRDRRDPNNLVVHVTAQVFEGLPFVSRISINQQIRGILARGQVLYPVKIAAFLFMGNHHHFILVGSGNLISPFMNYIQSEIAKAFIKFIPVKYENMFWKSRFSEQKLCTPEAVIEKLIYIYMNPIRAGLVKNIQQYPGVSSISSFLSGEKTRSLHSWTPSKFLQRLKNHYSRSDDLQDRKYILKNSESWHELEIDPFSWLQCFGIQPRKKEIHERLLLTLEAETKKAAHLDVLGRLPLLTQPLYRQYKPKKSGRTPFLQCHDAVLRIGFIKSYRLFCDECRKAWQSLKKGIAVTWPIGGYKPWHGWTPIFNPHS